jgi:hypothetical protein
MYSLESTGVFQYLEQADYRDSKTDKQFQKLSHLTSAGMSPKVSSSLAHGKTCQHGADTVTKRVIVIIYRIETEKESTF